jgi:hypothetical protein
MREIAQVSLLVDRRRGLVPGSGPARTVRLATGGSPVRVG